MSGSENNRWVALSALGAALFASGLSFVSVACDTREVSGSEAARAAGSVVLPVPASSLADVVKVVNAPSSAGSGAAPLTSAAPRAASSSQAIIDSPASNGLTLKRIVVTHKIQQREPVASDDFSLDSAPVYAFVELANAAKDPRQIRVLFRNEDTKESVGHVLLSVPGDQARFRTWGNTRLIRDAGHWVAVVSTTDGVELGRAPFEVKG